MYIFSGTVYSSKPAGYALVDRGRECFVQQTVHTGLGDALAAAAARIVFQTGPAAG